MEPMSSARAASDTRHRIAAANSLPRRIKLVGLGSGGGAILAGIASASLRDVQVVIPAAADVAPAGGRLPELAGAEMIFIVACSGDDFAWAAPIKQIARAANVMITAILVQAGIAQAGEQGPAHDELRVLRAASDMLIVASDASYVADMLAQLGA